MKIRRGDIVLVNFDPTFGHEIQKTRPALVITNDVANRVSRFVTVVPMTSKGLDRINRIEAVIKDLKGISKPSKALIQQLRSIDRQRVVRVIARATHSIMNQVDERVRLHLGLY